METCRSLFDTSVNMNAGTGAILVFYHFSKHLIVEERGKGGLITEKVTLEPADAPSEKAV